MMFPPSKPDVFAMPESGNTAGRGGYWDPRTKTAVDPRLAAGEKTGVFIIWGQSSTTNTVEGTYVPTNTTKLQNLSCYDGGVYRAAGSLLGCDFGSDLDKIDNLHTRVGDKLITAGTFQRMILAPCGMGGTFIAQWESSLYQRIIATWRRCLAQGYTVNAVLQQHGEWDNFYGTTQADYRSRGNSVISKVRAAGCNVPWYIAKSTYYSSPGPAIRAAIDQIVADNTNVFAGPDLDGLTTPTNRYDGVHFNAVGADAASTLWANFLGAIF